MRINKLTKPSNTKLQIAPLHCAPTQICSPITKLTAVFYYQQWADLYVPLIFNKSYIPL